MNIYDLYDFSSKEKVEEILDKNKKNIQKSNVGVCIGTIISLTYVFISLRFGIADIINVFVYLGLSIFSIVVWRLLRHRIMKHAFISQVYEHIKQINDKTNRKD